MKGVWGLLGKGQPRHVPTEEVAEATIRFSASYPFLYRLACDARKVLDKYNPPNYMAFNFEDEHGEQGLEIYVRRANGLSPSQVVMQLQEDVRAARAENDALRALLNAHMVADHPNIVMASASSTVEVGE